MVDNIGGGIGRLPDEAMRRRMAEYVDDLPTARHAVQLPAALVERYAGAYEMPSGGTVNVRYARGGLFVGPPGPWEIALAAQSETLFSGPDGITIEFQVDDDGTVTGFLLNQPSGQVRATRKP
jgi:hypothetical protein